MLCIVQLFRQILGNLRLIVHKQLRCDILIKKHLLYPHGKYRVNKSNNSSKPARFLKGVKEVVNSSLSFCDFVVNPQKQNHKVAARRVHHTIVSEFIIHCEVA